MPGSSCLHMPHVASSCSVMTQQPPRKACWLRVHQTPQKASMADVFGQQPSYYEARHMQPPLVKVLREAAQAVHSPMHVIDTHSCSGKLRHPSAQPDVLLTAAKGQASWLSAVSPGQAQLERSGTDAGGSSSVAAASCSNSSRGASSWCAWASP